MKQESVSYQEVTDWEEGWLCDPILPCAMWQNAPSILCLKLHGTFSQSPLLLYTLSSNPSSHAVVNQRLNY